MAHKSPLQRPSNGKTGVGNDDDDYYDDAYDDDVLNIRLQDHVTLWGSPFEHNGCKHEGKWCLISNNILI